jgi:hypothetical protein
VNSSPEPLLVRRDQLPLLNGFVPPRTATETVVETIWRAALHMDCVGVTDNYLDLGGDSFLAAIIFSMIAEAFGVEIPMAILVESPTIAELAAKIDGFNRPG